MRTSAPFTRKLTVLLAAAILRASTAGAVSMPPGSLAVMEPPLPRPEMRAAWDGIRNGIYLDPLLLVKGREEVVGELSRWRQGAESIKAAHQTANRVTLERTQALIEEAWGLYYRFEYQKADEVLARARELLMTPGDSGSRTRLFHELLVLKGVVAMAAGSNGHTEYFNQAAALEPQVKLPPEKYSPQAVSSYTRTRDNLLSGGQVPLVIEGSPADGRVRVGAGETAEIPLEPEFSVYPGKHFVEVSAPGYEPFSTIVDAQRFQPASVRFELMPAGPEGDPDSFFLQRLRSGDRLYMSLLARKLGVDYLFVPDPGEGELMGWLVDDEGRTVKHTLIWRPGESAETGAGRAGEVLQPLRQQWDRTAGVPLTLPNVQQGLPDDNGLEEKTGGWKKYAIAIGLVLLVGAVAGADGGRSTRIEATW